MATSAYQTMAIDIGVGLWYLIGHLVALLLLFSFKTDVYSGKNFSRPKGCPILVI